jgi:signal transduction histidine kinase
VTTELVRPFPPGLFFKSRLVLPVVVAIIQVMGTFSAAQHEPSRRALDLLAVVLLLAGPAALTVRDRYPVPVLLFTFTVAFAYELLGYVAGPNFLSVAVAVVAAIVRGHRRAGIAVVAIGYATFVWGEFVLGLGGAPELPEAIAVGAWLTALVAVPEVFRVRRERFIEASRSQAEERKRRASEERLRIAQELHDVLAHNISLINVQAGTALHLLDERPDSARPALTAIKEASNEALSELRSVLEVLLAGSDEAPRSPTPGLAQLDTLIARTRAAGFQVVKRIEGEARALPASVDRAAFRIVQESLTNVTRHAGEATAVVSLRYGAQELEIEVEDNGRGASSGRSEGGNGIPGMRERALALGGTFDAGPRTDAGFGVRARLPYETHPAEDVP